MLGGDTAAFWGALRYYKSNHEESYVLTSDFTQEYQAYTGLSLNWFFDEWLYKAGHPKYQVNWYADSLGPGNWEAHVTIDQVQSHDYNVPTFKMPIPLEFATAQGDTTFVVWDSLETQAFTLSMLAKPTLLRFDPDNWVIDSHKVTTGVDEKPVDVTVKFLSAGPNPVRNRYTVCYTAPCGAVAEIALYSVDGRLVAKRSMISSEGRNDLVVDFRPFTPGLYIAEFRVNGVRLARTKAVRP